ncbi:TadE family type IV pilus minor pilin [Lysinibacter sp. HNR]|uniref:TadE family type IV pilus minor pilin n=1 Tax=Lysinibacter sp. HNR TaxID=3031408 RepID=UPI0024358206|nr:TadE family type IV pilus minor pilin [Lysinibacter sp. HNR]WGD37078.1 TadE family type IV pilus minor pilin [Lysinibacter sp. HNR]
MPSDRGSVTAEFAIVLPVAIAVLGICLAVVALIASQVRLTDAAADVARLLARHDDPTLITRRLAAIGGDVSVQQSRESGFVCVELSAPGFDSPPLNSVIIFARACALAWPE